MPAILEVSSEERIPLAFIIAAEIGRLSRGTREHRDIADGLREVYSTLLDAPDGPLQVDFANDELYMVGVHIFVDSTELEDYWLDNRSSLRAINQPAPYPDESFGRAVSRFFPEVIDRPDDWRFDSVRGHFQNLSRRIDEVMRQFAPNARGLYNKERKEIIARTLATQRERTEARSRRYPRNPDAEIWRRAVRADELATGEMTAVEIDGRRILVANTGDGFAAIDAACTHVPPLAMIATMEKGRLDLDQMCVECPWHGSRFDLRTGEVVRQPYAPDFNRDHFFSGRLTGVLDPKKTSSPTRVYPTKLTGNQVFVNIA